MIDATDAVGRMHRSTKDSFVAAIAERDHADFIITNHVKDFSLSSGRSRDADRISQPHAIHMTATST
ncbi:hypothetical protein [Bifidobacterium miconis]|uniref:hypothetical protein n=1 Tax=Bifidobacterium miconis TaxID=2834435 RepID=UPI001F35A0D3|nr:hypothetical protein [Bifidobacterium miconis]